MEYNNDYPGTRLYIFHIDGTVYEPFKQEKNVFLERPVYSSERNSFGIIRYDFEEEIIKLYEYQPKVEKLVLLTESEMKEAGDLINVRVVKEPFMLVKHEIHDDRVNFIWPFRKHFHFEENESLDFIDGEMFITSKWIEDPDYREEVLWRRLSDGEIIERKAGYVVEMSDGNRWIMTK